jgi:hypothetical protein
MSCHCEESAVGDDEAIPVGAGLEIASFALAMTFHLGINSEILMRRG